MNYKVKRFFVTLTLLLVPYLASAGSLENQNSSKVITLGTWSNSPFSSPDQQGLLDKLMQTAFKRCCNLSVILKTLPAERSLISANTGLVDGELPRIAGISGPNKKYPNLLQVNESVLPTTYVAFTKDPKIKIDQWHELENYRVGIILGWKILERNITKYRSLIKVKNGESLFSILNKDRVDVVIFNRLVGVTTLEKMGLHDIYGAKSEAFKTSKDKWYLYMHQKHKALVPKLEKVLLEMKQDGTYHDIYRNSLATFLPAGDEETIIYNALHHIGAKTR
jgi:polar amino acid transport system substrate-binding protein